MLKLSSDKNHVAVKGESLQISEDDVRFSRNSKLKRKKETDAIKALKKNVINQVGRGNKRTKVNVPVAFDHWHPKIQPLHHDDRNPPFDHSEYLCKIWPDETQNS